MSNEHNFTFDPHTAFDLDALPVTKLMRMLRELGERGDFARVLKAKQIALIEAHPTERQIAALRAIGENPESLRLSEYTPNADEAIRALLDSEADASRPKVRGKGIRSKGADRTTPAPKAVVLPPEPVIEPAPVAPAPQDLPLPEEPAPMPSDIEHVVSLMAQLMAAGRRMLDRELVAQVVREELAKLAGSR